MSNENKKSFREKIQAIPAFIASIIAILAAIISIFTWISGYFATQAQLKKARCITGLNAEIMSNQIDQIILGNEFFKKTLDVIKLENSKKKDPNSFNNDDEAELRELQSDVESIYKRKENAKDNVDRLSKVLKSGDISASSEECKPFKGDLE